jgi:hypothetical protein
MKLTTLFAVTVAATFSLGLNACAESQGEDELAGETTDEIADNPQSKADSSNSYTYYMVTPDLLRRCASPKCGGKFLARLNRTTTKCHTGTNLTQCYVPELDYSQSGLSASDIDGAVGNLIVRGRFANKTYEGMGNLGTFVVTEAWAAASDAAPSGVFVRVKDSGARCITAPCLTITESALNSDRQANVSEIDYTDTGLSGDALGEVTGSIFKEGLIIAGDRYYQTVNGTRTKGRAATAVYQKVVAAKAPAASVR